VRVISAAFKWVLPPQDFGLIKKSDEMEEEWEEKTERK
jgi:hypothetical protein